MPSNQRTCAEAQHPPKNRPWMSSACPGNKRTAPQSSDQQLAGNNLALAVNIWRKRPIRVVRGYKLKSECAPAEGYR